VQVPDSSSLDITGPLTVDAWVLINRLNPQIGKSWPVVWKGTSSADITTPYALGLLGNLNQMYGIVANGSSENLVTGTTTLQTGTWYHVALVADGTFVRLYVNGTLDGSVPQTVSPFVNTATLRVGGIAGSTVNIWDGKIDELEIFNRALSQNEIAEIYTAGSLGKCRPKPVISQATFGHQIYLDWPFDPSGPWTLQTATNIQIGPWVPVPTGTNPPLVMPMTNKQGFFRLTR
jgi:hypothetical protein